MASNKMQERIRSSAIGTAILSLIAFYVGDRIGTYIKIDLNMNLGNQFMQGIQSIMINPFFIDLEMSALVVGVILCCTVWLIWLRYVVFVGNYRTGEESGSAQWGTQKEGEAFKDPKNPENNLLFTKHYGLALKREKFDLEHDRNLNVMVIGGTGSGKTRHYVKPNLMQLNANYFVTDPKGSLIEESGYLFRDNGYEIKSFNTIDFGKSQHYNPLAYVETDADILSFVNCFILNTTDPKKTGGDGFWEDSERMLYSALIALLRDWFPKSDYSLDGLLTLLSLAEAKENDEDFESPLDLIFKEIETGKVYRKNPEYGKMQQQDKNPGISESERSRAVIDAVPAAPAVPEYIYAESVMRRRDGVMPGPVGGLSPDEDFALSLYKKFKVAAGKTLKSIIVSCNVRMSRCEIHEIRDLLKYDEMELDRLGDEDCKSIIFAILSDTDKSFSFIHAIMMWQAIDLLCRKASKIYHGRLPRLVNFIFDEFANIGKLPDIEQTIAVTRSRNIAISIILQSMAQLDARYDKDAKTIIDCCDTTLFLGGKSNSTNEEIAKMIGKETIHQATFGESHGQSSSGSKNMQIQGRDLIDAAEIGKMSRKKAILLIAGTNPLKDEKYPVETHPNYIYLDPGSNKLCPYSEPFDFNDYLKNRRSTVQFAGKEA